MLDQGLFATFALAHIGTLSRLLQVVAQALLCEHDLFGTSNDEVAPEFLATLTRLKRLLGLQLGQPALAASKHERDATQQDILQSLGQHLLSDGVLHQQRHANLQEIGAFVQAAHVGHNRLSGFVLGRNLCDLIALTPAPIGTHHTSILQLQGLRIRSLEKLRNLFGQKGVLGVQVVANQWKPRVAKQAVQKFPRDLHFLDD